MENLLNKLRQTITDLTSNPEFIHHQWFIDWHLKIAEKISLELLEIYHQADKDLIMGMVWMHDYPKIIDFEDQYNPQILLNQGQNLLIELGFPNQYIKKLIKYIRIIDSNLTVDLSNSPIEVRLVSTADGVSHLFGLFYLINWYENPQKKITELIESNINKLNKDWNRKIVLPGIKALLQPRYDFLVYRQISGAILTAHE